MLAAMHVLAALGGQDVPLLLVDYWAEAPGKQSVARLAFSTPHVGIRDEMLRLTDKVLFSTEWILGQPSEDAPTDLPPVPDPETPDPADPTPGASAPAGPQPGAPAPTSPAVP